RFVASPVAHKGLVVAPSAKNRGVAGIQLAEAKGLINAGGKGESWRINKGTPDVPSPLVYDKLVYLCRESGVGICLDAQTGEKYYEERVYAQTYRASPVAANGRIIFTARDGTFSVLKAGKTLEVLAKNKLDDQFTASPAIYNERLYLRGYGSLYCIGKK
ncbi:MAG: pyrrolo-quinoline quinone, partial [Opitutae bacterium]